MLVRSLEVCEFNLQDVLVVVAGSEDLAMVDPNVLALEATEEVFEGVLEVGVGALDLVVGVEVLVREVDALPVHRQ